MSGIYIPGVSVPADDTVLLRVYPEENGYCFVEWIDGIDQDFLGSYWAVPVPLHGRLIDADALMAYFKEIADIEWNKKAAPINWSYAFEDVLDDVENMPTIIPAEEGER